ncbi:MAG: oxygen-dependent coproporphyrinogen oxidase [Crocinitomicaceae bacterium]|nr:oxygen-dependent coproporphyrinogen oxidase [Crocinitomicaceae bacterium]
MTKDDVAREMRDLQDYICGELEKLDTKGRFIEDKWQREQGGGGRTRIIESDQLIEKGGVNFSEVYGDVTPMMKNNTEITGDSFFATGVSIVLHPNNPHVPIIHMNVRYFEMDNGTYWFGGGIDLTPHYIVPAQAKEFHLGLKTVCDKYSENFYLKFKTWADNYFFIPHRDETRGIGGIFFDHISEDASLSKQDILSFCMNLGREFPKLYQYQAELGREKEISEEESAWMHLRRGRYVEFNLVHDRGTKFGLVSGGRTESILMSLPKNASWVYNNVPVVGSKEQQTQELLVKNVDWVNFH